MHKDQIKAWIALGWLCRDLGVALIDCPEVVRRHSSGGHVPFLTIMGSNCVRLVDTANGVSPASGFALRGLSVVYYNGIDPDGEPTDIGARNSKHATWADLAASIESARWAARYAHKHARLATEAERHARYARTGR